MRGIQKHVLILLLCSIWLGVPSYEIVKASTDVPSIINSDTTWTKIDSPYELKGPVLVSNGVILTIEPGVTVNLNGFYIQVDGTLDAIGSSTDQILFNSGTIRFTEYSTDWDEQTNSGCRIENSDLSSVQIDIINSPKISNNSICYTDISCHVDYPSFGNEHRDSIRTIACHCFMDAELRCVYRAGADSQGRR